MSTTPPPDNQIEQWKYLTLSAIAYGALADNDEDEARFNLALRYVFRGYKKLALTRHYAIKTVEIPMLPWKQIAFPKDMVDWCIVGFRMGDMLKVLTQDTKIPRFWDKVNGVKQENTSQFPMLTDAEVGQNLVPLLGGMLGNSAGDKMFGNVMQYNYAGYFDVDFTNRVINFKETVTGYSKVYLQYITDGLNYEGATVIHPYLEEPLLNWTHWKFKLHDTKVGLAERREFERIYNNSVDELDIMRLNLSLQDVWESLRAGYRLTPKN